MSSQDKAGADAWAGTGLFIALTDVILINIAFALAYWLRYQVEWPAALDSGNFQPYRVWFPIGLTLTGILLLAYQLEGVYDLKRGIRWLDDLSKLFTGTLIGIAVLTVLTFNARPQFYSRLMLGYAGVLIVAVLGASRLVFGTIRAWRYRRGIGVDRVLVVGCGDIGRTVMGSIMARPELGYQVAGFLDDDPERQHQDLGRFRALGSVDALPAVLRSQDIDEVIVALPWRSIDQIMDIMAHCEPLGVRARIVPDLFQLRLNRVDIDDISGVPLIGVRDASIRGWNRAIKRLSDIVVAAISLVVASPLLAVVAILIKWDSPGPVLFPQIRVGRDGRQFTLYKFRSMVVGADEEKDRLLNLNEASGPLFKIRDDPRLTRVGRWLRRLSIDELPQLWNVLNGDMSLVGPRPPVPAEVDQYQPWHRKRLLISPGVTGLWQVSGRSKLTFDEMVMLDLFYAENWSLWLDFKIMLRTIPTVIMGTGAY
ncbi:MAG: undecaprenyl-phosphate glucose phosphotransferase [Anaerolineae bacterium]